MEVELEAVNDPTIGEIILAPNFKTGECANPIAQEKYGQLLKAQNSEGRLGGERAIDIGDKLLISGGYRDKFLYLYGSQVSSEAKRKDFTIFLRKCGILQMISKFILTLQEMQVRPPPDQTIEFMLKSMGSTLVIRDILKEMKTYRNDTKKRIEQLQKESAQLRLRLENHSTVFTTYEALDPDDFAHLAQKLPPSGEGAFDWMFPAPPTPPPPTPPPSIRLDEIVDELLFQKGKNGELPVQHDAEMGDHNVDVDQEDEDEMDEEAEEVEEEQQFKPKDKKKIPTHSMIRRQIIPSQRKSDQISLNDRQDLDVEGLFGHFKTLRPPDLGIGPFISKSKLATATPSTSTMRIGGGGDCGILLKVDVDVEDGPRSTDRTKMPPLVVTQQRKYTQGTLKFRAPPPGQTVKHNTLPL